MKNQNRNFLNMYCVLPSKSNHQSSWANDNINQTSSTVEYFSFYWHKPKIFHYPSNTCIKNRKDSTISQSIVKSWNVITVVSGINSSIIIVSSGPSLKLSHFLFISNRFEIVVGLRYYFVLLMAIWKSFSCDIYQFSKRQMRERERERTYCGAVFVQPFTE